MQAASYNEYCCLSLRATAYATTEGRKKYSPFLVLQRRHCSHATHNLLCVVCVALFFVLSMHHLSFSFSLPLPPDKDREKPTNYQHRGEEEEEEENFFP